MKPIEFKLIPIRFVIDRSYKYHLSILGFHWGNCEMGMGITYMKQKFENRHEWELGLHFYNFHKRIIIKTVYHEFNYICPDCGGFLWKHNLYCQVCGDKFELDEVKRIDHKIF